MAVNRGIVGRNPCPQCGDTPQLLAGAVVFGNDADKSLRGLYVLVCWPCHLYRLVQRGQDWTPMHGVPLNAARRGARSARGTRPP